MSRWPAMFRILLCALLLVNAVGTAAASAMHVAGSHATAGTHGAMASPPSQASDCHDTGAGGMDHDGQPAAPAPDCCGDDCSTCTGFGHALPPQPPVSAAGWNVSAASAVPERGHASAALPRLVRPPIGQA